MTSNTVPTGAQVQANQDRLLFNVQCAAWTQNARIAVSKNLFRKIQFIRDDTAEATGSRWMILVCDSIGCPEASREEFWNRSGKKAASNALNRRRFNVTRQMKSVFLGEWSCGQYCVTVLVLPNLLTTLVAKSDNNHCCETMLTYSNYR
jgi:hypothetical protein